MTHDNWNTAADQSGGIEGLHVKCTKGTWTADDAVLEPGPDGARIVVVMPSATIGLIRWQDGKPVERMVGKVEDGFTSPEAPDENWSQYTECLVVFVDDKHRGASGTFTSSSWGGRFGFWKLVKPYARMRAYPICTLGTKPRGDKNGNIDPVFVISGWANPDEFPGFAQMPQITGPSSAPGYADVIDGDEIVF